MKMLNRKPKTGRHRLLYTTATATAVAAAAVIAVLSPQSVSLAAAGEADVTGTGTTLPDGFGGYNGNTDDELVGSSTGISVMAKTSGGNEIVYDVDISWGGMMFEYYYGQTWNPVTHSYTNVDGEHSDGGWVTDGYINAENNRITVVNNSNFPMTADFSFQINGDALNAAPGAEGSVTGIFSSSNDVLAAGDGALLKEGVGGVNTSSMLTDRHILEMDKTSLLTNSIYYYAQTDGGATFVNEYFALSGVPDVNSSRSFTEVGTITVAISPATNTIRSVIP